MKTINTRDETVCLYLSLYQYYSRFSSSCGDKHRWESSSVLVNCWSFYPTAYQAVNSLGAGGITIEIGDPNRFSTLLYVF